MYANVKILGMSAQRDCVCGGANVSLDLINDEKVCFLKDGGDGSREGPI